MRTRTLAAAGLLAAGLLLTACSNTSGDKAADKPVGVKADGSFDCTDPGLSKADYAANCTGPAAAAAQPFGKAYAWPDGVKVTVTRAKVFTGYDRSSGEKPSKGSTDYQVSVKVTNGSSAPLDLGNLSVITAGATNGGEAAATSWGDGGDALQGQLAPGVTATKTDDETLATKFGRKIVVTVQRSTDDGSTLPFPKFTGSITG